MSFTLLTFVLAALLTIAMPATFLSVTTAEDCGGYEQQACMEIPYRWDAAARRLLAGTPVRGRSLRLE